MGSDFISGQAQIPDNPIWIWVTVLTAFMLAVLILSSLTNEKEE